MNLRHKLLILLISVGSIGLTGFALVIATTDYQLFSKFVPEIRSLRDVETRSALLIQNYYRYMLTRDIIDIDVLAEDLVLIQNSLADYSRLIAGQPEKEQRARQIAKSIDGLAQAGNTMIRARQSFARIIGQQEMLEDQIEQVFRRYRDAISVDIGDSIQNRNWSGLTKTYIPELRMIDSMNQQLLKLFLEIREYQIESSYDSVGEIELLGQQIRNSSAMLEVYIESASSRIGLSQSILEIYNKMISVVDEFTISRRQAEFAVSRAEQSGIDLNESIQSAIRVSDLAGWKTLRTSLFLAGAILMAALVISYILLYSGLNRILQPLGKLQTVIGRLGKGDYKQRSEIDIADDEIGQLASSFNRMADKLENNVEQQQLFIEQLEQKNMELERFTYTVSHELKSPLVTVSGFLGLLEKDLQADNRERIADDMQKISFAIEVMSKQLEDLLELSRVGRAANPATQFSISEIAGEVVQMMRGLIDECDAAVEIDDNMPVVFADQARIREVLKNLVENAIKFAYGTGKPYIRINASQSDDVVLCRVEDNGPGIEPRYQDKVFGLFDRLDTGIPGTGVGLALVKRIIEIHNGDIWIESQGDGQGCCFCFTLPVQRGI